MKEKDRSKVWLIVTTSLWMAGCSFVQKSPVPGVSAEYAQIDTRKISTTDVIKAIKLQVGRAMADIERARAGFSDNNVAQKLVFKTGKGSFSGQTEVFRSDKGELSLILPFSGFSGTQGSPSGSLTRETVAVQGMAFAFNIEPGVETREYPAESDEDEFIRDGLVAAFSDLVRMGDGASGPKIVPSSLQFVASFTVSRKHDGGLSLKIVPTTPRLKEAGPGYKVSSVEKGTYKLELTLPFAETSPADTRRLIYTIIGQDGQSLSVEEPYTRKRYDELRQIIGIQRDARNWSGGIIPFLQQHHFLSSENGDADPAESGGAPVLREIVSPEAEPPDL